MGTIQRKVALQDVRFFAFHGYYPEEQVVGCEFFVDVEVAWDVDSGSNDELADTVNYEQLYSITANQMSKPRKLIETIAHGILKDIRSEFAFLKSIHVAISKMNPPLPGEVKKSLIKLIYTA